MRLKLQERLKDDYAGGKKKSKLPITKIDKERKVGRTADQ